MDVTLQEAKAIAKEAYIFFQPVVYQYSLKLSTGKRESNIFTHLPFLPGPEFPFPYKCDDNMYATAFLDLRMEPIVLHIPAVEKDRYISVMCVDHFSHNFAYFGTRTTGNDEADYMIAGPGWKGNTPDTIKESVIAESHFDTVIVRIQVNGSEDDIKIVDELLKQLTCTPLSVFKGDPMMTPLPEPDFPPYEEDQQVRAGFFKYVNFFIGFATVHPSEACLYTQFARIGVYGGALFPPVNMDSAVIEAIEQGIWEGSNAIDLEIQRPVGVQKQGWSYNIDPPPVGSREDMDQRYLARAATARGLFKWGNSIQEATYMQAFKDADGEDFNDSNEYTLHWSANEIPRVNAYWSVTMYDREGQYHSNTLKRYNIGSNTIGLVYNSDNSLTLYIQNQNPGTDKASNWLPCPDGPFQLFMRIYLPKDEMIYGKYSDHIPPGAKKV